MSATVMNVNVQHMNVSQENKGVWLLEGQASQRELLLTLREYLPENITLYASHKDDRPEITACADVAWREPTSDVRVDWVLSQAVEFGIVLVWACKKGELYEPHRARFEALGITLITGAISEQNLLDLDHKADFAVRCSADHIPVATGWAIETAAELHAIIAEHGEAHQLCAKPIHGIFGQGFWRLIDDLDVFYCYLNPDSRMVNTAQFVSAYAESTSDKIAKPMIIMPYLSGDEYSVDMVCEDGIVIEAVARVKREDKTQVLYHQHDVIELAKRVSALFRCDGLVNMQTKANDDGAHHVLEINARPSGGVGYTLHSGINLAVTCVFRRLGLALPIMPILFNEHRNEIVVRPFTSSTLLD